MMQRRLKKVTASEMPMSESAVAVHLGNVTKKMQATDRTERAYRADGLWSDARVRPDRLFQRGHKSRLNTIAVSG